MHFHWPLFVWLFRPLRWLTVAGSVVTLGHVMSQTAPLDFYRDLIPALFIVGHSFLVTRLIARVRSESFVFLYSQGLGRDTVFWHVWLATLASVLGVVLPSAIAVLSPLRGLYQDWLQNPWFPVMATTEWPYIPLTLLAYGIVLPVFQYEWVRSAMPDRGFVSGHALSLVFVVLVLYLSAQYWLSDALASRSWTDGGFAVASLILGIQGWRLHRRMEVCVMNFPFPYFFTNTVTSCLAVLPLAYLMFKHRRWSKSKSQAWRRAPVWIRGLEVLVLGVLAITSVLPIAIHATGLVNPVPNVTIVNGMQYCVVALGIASCWLVVAWRSVALAAAGMILSALFVPNLIAAFAHAEEKLQDPVADKVAKAKQEPRSSPIEFILEERVSDVDLILNGVRMGKMPLATTFEEVEAKLPGARPKKGKGAG